MNSWMCPTGANNWHVNSSTIDMSILQQLKNKVIYRDILISFYIHFQCESINVFYIQLCGRIFNFGRQNILAGKCWSLVGEFRNFSAKFFGRLNSKMSIDNHECNEHLRLFWKFEAKILKNVRDNSVYNFMVNCWIVETCQLLKNWHVNCWHMWDTVKVNNIS